MIGRTLLLSFAAILLAACTENTRPILPEANEADIEKFTADYNERVESDHDKAVCEKVAVTGSRVKEVRCRTAAQKAAEAEDGKEYLDKARLWHTKEQ